MPISKSRTSNNSPENFWQNYKHYIIPSGIGFLVAWVFSGSFDLSAAVFVGVWIGNWIAYSMRDKK